MDQLEKLIPNIIQRRHCTVVRRATGGICLVLVQTVEIAENKRFYANGECKGDLTTSKELSNGEFKGYAYKCKTIQPKGYVAEIVMVEEFKLKLTTEEKVLNSYTIYA